MQKKILFVCTGNTCRSPMAQAIATSIFKEENLDILVASAGIMAFGSHPASANAALAMENLGLNIATHMSTQLTADTLQGVQLVLAMTQGHLQAIKSLVPRANVYTLAQYANSTGDIADPYGGSLAIYTQCATQIHTLLNTAMPKLKEELWNS